MKLDWSSNEVQEVILNLPLDSALHLSRNFIWAWPWTKRNKPQTTLMSKGEWHVGGTQQISNLWILNHASPLRRHLRKLSKKVGLLKGRQNNVILSVTPQKYGAYFAHFGNLFWPLAPFFWPSDFWPFRPYGNCRINSHGCTQDGHVHGCTAIQLFSKDGNVFWVRPCEFVTLMDSSRTIFGK